LFQNLYEWIKEIEDFATSKNRNIDKIMMRYHDPEGLYYFLYYHKSYIVIRNTFVTEQPPGGIQFRTDNSNMGAKIEFKTIGEFKKRLLDYTKSHGIDIRE